MFKERFNTLNAGNNVFGIKLLFVGIIILLFLIPSKIITSLVEERSYLEKEAIESVYKPLGGYISYIGPFISVPIYHSGNKNFFVLSDKNEMIIDAKIVQRKRGIFKAPVVNAHATIQFSFNKSDIEQSEKHARYDFDKAELVFIIPDSRLLQDEITVQFDGENSIVLNNTTNYSDVIRDYCVVSAPLSSYIEQEQINGIMNISLRGGDSMSFTTGGGASKISLHANWISPSFNGFMLPHDSQIDDNGFNASWFISKNTYQLPSGFILSENEFDTILKSKSSVDFIQPVNTYRMVYRAVNYSILFIIVPFIALFLFELFACIRIHPIQYILTGFVSVLFFLLLLSFSEHISFFIAYIISAFACVTLISMYLYAVSHKHKYSPLAGAALLFLYGFLYCALQSEDYALLIGSIGLFIIAASIMILTRNVDWYKKVQKQNSDNQDNKTDY